MTHCKYPDSSLCALDETQLFAKLADHTAAAADRSADVDGIARAQDLARQARDILFSRGYLFDPNEKRKLQFLDWNCAELKRGFFLSFEGIDGSGKSSQLQCARLHLEASGVEVVVTREPGGTELAESIRGLFLGHVMSAHTEALLAFAARRDHLERVIWPALARGAWVLCDRYVDSTFAYQGGGRGLDTRIIEALAEWSIGDFEPNATFLFDVSTAAAQGRLSGRAWVDRIEAETAEFHSRVRDAFLARSVEWAHRFSVFNAEQEETFVRTEMLNELNLLLDRWQTRCNSGDFS